MAEIGEAAGLSQNANLLPSDDGELLALTGIADLPAPADGLFRAGSWIRKISGEPVLLFGGGRALLLEIAHPLVAAGVAEHSNFRTDPFGRLQRTLDAMNAIVFRDRDSALAAARGIENAHHRIRGTLGVDVGHFAAGTSYYGRDPELVRWVWATLVDTTVVVYERFVAPLARDALEAYYAEHRAVALVLGVPAEMVPSDYGDFCDYMAGMLEGDDLVVSALAREVAAAVLDPPVGAPNAKLVRLITAALLPERLRNSFDLEWNDAKHTRFESMLDSVRALRPRESVDSDRATR